MVKFKINKKIFLCTLVIYTIGIGTGIYIIPIESKEFIIQEKSEASISEVIKYFKHNILICLIAMSGIFIFSIPTLILLFINGVIVGAAIHFSVISNMDVNNIFLSLLPHGVFEIPGFLISSYIGMLGLKFYFETKRNNIYLLKLVALSFVLIMLAAIAETYISK